MDKIFVTPATITGVEQINNSASVAIREHLATLPPGTEMLIAITPFKAIAGAMNIVPLEKILADLQYLETLTATQIEYTDTNAVLDLLNEISAWLAYAARLQSHCKYYWRAAEISVFKSIPDEILKLSTSERNRWLRAQTAEFESLYELAERIAAAMTHRCEHLRSFLSYEKALLNLGNFPTSEHPK